MSEKNKDDYEKQEETEDLSEESSDEKDELEEKNLEIEQIEDQLLRLRADFSNYKRRTEQSKLRMADYAIESIVKDILPIVDDFERALESVEDSEKEESFYQGVELIYGQLIKVLSNNNVEEIEAIDQEFDPNLHHAVFMEEKEGYDENIVIEVMQKGYRLKDKVVRPAMVKVSK